MADEKEKPQGKEAAKGGRPSLTPEQEAEAAKKKAARAEAKTKGGGKGGAAAAKHEVAQEKVKRSAPPRLKTVYETELRSKLMQELGLKNPMQVPKVTKITINVGLGEAVTNPKLLDTAVEELTAITGQK